MLPSLGQDRPPPLQVAKSPDAAPSGQVTVVFAAIPASELELSVNRVNDEPGGTTFHNVLEEGMGEGMGEEIGDWRRLNNPPEILL
jgi:hypothetical protein